MTTQPHLLMKAAGMLPSESAEDVVARVLEPGETIVWAGRPNADVMTRQIESGRPGAVRAGVLLVAVAAFVYFGMDGRSGVALPDSPDEILYVARANVVPLTILLGIVATFFLLRKKGWDPASSYARWARSLAYAITDRRLLILENGEVSHELGPEDFGEPRICDRGEGHSDVEFKRILRSSDSRSSRYGRDRRQIAFKALLDAEDIRRKVEDWRRQHREREEEQVAEFLEGSARPSVMSGASQGTRTIRNEHYGLTMNVPETWDVKVRKRRKPYGRIFLDFARWKSPDELTDWNVIRAEGDFHTSIEVHLDLVRKRVVVYQQARNSSLVNAVAGDIVETDEALRYGRFEGFSITRNHVVHGSAQSAGDIGRPALNRYIMLHDGRMQVGVNMVWPQDSEPLRRAVHKVFETMTLG